MLTPVKPGDVVRLRKKHPCGSDEWQVFRVDARIGIECLKCHRRIVLERSAFRHRMKSLYQSG